MTNSNSSSECHFDGHNQIRVLVVDDSATARLWIKSILTDQAGLEVVGLASGGSEAVSLCAKLKPDVVTMDLLMPEMDGLEATRKIMAGSPCKIVIVSSSADSHEASFAIKALAAGALFVVDKPAGPLEKNYQAGINQLRAAVRSAGGIDLQKTGIGSHPIQILTSRPVTSFVPKMLVIGTSAGGPPALLRILKGLPKRFPCPIAIAQHMSVGYMAGLSQWLASECEIEVRPATNREAPLSGVVYLPPDGAHIAFDSFGQIHCESTPPINRFRPSVDRLFSTAARVYGKDLLAIVLSGMGDDGCEGAGEIRRNGGQVIAQDRMSSVVWGMPGAVVKAQHASQVLPLEEIAGRLMDIASIRKVG